MVSSVSYLGYVIDAQGLHPHPDKVLAIQQALTPSNVTQLMSYVGLLSYYGKFLSNLSTLLGSLYTLLGPLDMQQEEVSRNPKSYSLLQSKPPYAVGMCCVCKRHHCCASSQDAL